MKFKIILSVSLFVLATECSGGMTEINDSCEHDNKYAELQGQLVLYEQEATCYEEIIKLKLQDNDEEYLTKMLKDCKLKICEVKSTLDLSQNPYEKYTLVELEALLDQSTKDVTLLNNIIKDGCEKENSPIFLSQRNQEVGKKNSITLAIKSKK